MMHIAISGTSILVALAFLLGLSNLQVQGSDAIDRGWQTAISPVTLNLRNKLTDAPYTVTFIVTTVGQDAEWSHTTESEPNAWQRPQFPKDFEGPDVDHRQAQRGALVVDRCASLSTGALAALLQLAASKGPYRSSRLERGDRRDPCNRYAASTTALRADMASYAAFYQGWFS